MIKSLFKGIVIGLGIILGIYLASKIGLLGLSSSIKSFSIFVGELFSSISDFFMRLGGG